jgi:hypothetical protein
MQIQLQLSKDSLIISIFAENFEICLPAVSKLSKILNEQVSFLSGHCGEVFLIQKRQRQKSAAMDQLL